MCEALEEEEDEEEKEREEREDAACVKKNVRKLIVECGLCPVWFFCV